MILDLVSWYPLVDPGKYQVFASWVQKGPLGPCNSWLALQMDTLVARMVMAPASMLVGHAEEGKGGSIWGGHASTLALALAVVGRRGAVQDATRGVSCLCKAVLPGVLSDQVAQSEGAQLRQGSTPGTVSGSGPAAGAPAGHDLIHVLPDANRRGSRDAPLLLKMRDTAPPSFWDPERCVVPIALCVTIACRPFSIAPCAVTFKAIPHKNVTEFI